MKSIALPLLVVIFGVVTLASLQAPQVAGDVFPAQVSPELTKNPLTLEDQAKIQGLTTAFSTSEWLGPLAPVAISPFFGITLLAGLSQFGGDWVAGNAFLSDNPVLNSPLVFWAFLGLTVLTALPKLTKVSKPLAQIVDQIEAYAGIITIVLIRVLASASTGDQNEPVAMVVQMGFLSFSADVLFSVAAIINIIVINTVKFFFELLTWMIPVPMIDAGLEFLNKTICGVLMAIYLWSPLAATILNLILFAMCVLVFRWVKRKVQFFRSVACDPIISMVSKSFSTPKDKELVVFPLGRFESYPSHTKLILRPTEDGWQLIRPRMLLSPEVMDFSRQDFQLTIRRGFFVNSIELKSAASTFVFGFSRRFSSNLDLLAKKIEAEFVNEEADLGRRPGLSWLKA